MVGRLLRGMALFSMAVIVAWMAWFWPERPVWAASGAVIVATAWVGVLALEFALLAGVRRGDPAPAASVTTLLRAAWGEAGAAARVFLWWQPWREQRWPDLLDVSRHRGRRAVVLVHGFVCNRAVWTPWMQAFHEQDQPFVALSLEPVFGSIDGLTGTLDEAVRRVQAVTGVAPLVVCHSMGGLVARSWLSRVADAASRVHRVATLGSPHAGTWLARWSHWPNAVQMRRGGRWLTELGEAEDADDAVRRLLGCWYSNCDNIVMPPSTAVLSGASAHFFPGLGHVALALSPRVREDVTRWGL